MPQEKKKPKRENGKGSIYKRSDAKLRPWVALAPAALQYSGGELSGSSRIVIGRFAKYNEAEEALREYMRSPTPKYNMTLEQIYDEWSEIAYRSLSRQTKDNYRASWAKLERLKEIKFREIRTGQMQAIIDGLSSMSFSSLSKLKALLSQLFDYASENDIVNKNYAKFLVLPKHERVKKDCFTDIELEKIKTAAGTVHFADAILIMCYTGFRISEFLELTRFSYDAAANTLTGGMKTAAGRDRPVPVHPEIKPYLDLWLAKNGETIICNENGKPYTTKYFREKCYRPALAAIDGVRELPPHATRRTFGTRLSAAGARAEDIQALIGHENYDMTVSAYIKQDIETLRTALLKLV